MTSGKPKTFYSTVSAAKELGVSLRTIGRLSEDYDIEPMRVEGRGVRLRHFWLEPHLVEFRKHLKGNRA